MDLNRCALTDMREARGMTKTDLAVQSGVSLSYISELESGVKRGISAKKLVALAGALRCHVTTLTCAPAEYDQVA